jgi:hypothetical protein
MVSASSASSLLQVFSQFFGRGKALESCQPGPEVSLTAQKLVWLAGLHRALTDVSGLRSIWRFVRDD